MSVLTSAAVEKVLLDCLFKEGEPIENPVIMEGIITNFGFHPGRLAENKKNIRQLLDELPDEFKEEASGGMSFLNACVDKHGDHWGEHTNMEQLLCIGLAAGMVEYCMPRSMWRLLPGGMPYFIVLRKKDDE